MTSWLVPDTPLSDSATHFRRLWAERWADCHPRWGSGAPDALAYDHRHAHPEFRNPLSSADGIRASAEFHGAVVSRLANGSPLTLVTFDYENIWEGERTYTASELNDLLDRDPIGTLVEHSDDADPDDETRIHVFISTVDPDDTRLPQIWHETAQGAEPLVVTAGEQTWLARPHEECVAVTSFDEADVETLRTVEGETWARWGIPVERLPNIDLAAVASYFEARRGAWSRDGVRVETGPQYRTWNDPETIDRIVLELPEDLRLTDWFLIGLASNAAEATVIVHDSGTCTVQLDRDVDDEDSQMLFEHRDRAGTLDFDGVTSVIERVVSTVAS